MANYKSSIKRIRQNEKKRIRNRLVKAACRTAIKKTRKAVEEGRLEEAGTLFKEAEKSVASAATKGVFKKKNASRKISRLAQLVQKARKAA